jgi:hypothetical protein
LPSCPRCLFSLSQKFPGHFCRLFLGLISLHDFTHQEGYICYLTKLAVFNR